MSQLWTALSVPKACGMGGLGGEEKRRRRRWVEGGGSYRSCSFDFSTCSLISDLDTNHPRAPGCMTVHEQIIRMRKVWAACNILSTGDQYCWWLPPPISNPVNSLLAMGETCIMCQVAVWFVKPCREIFSSEVLPFHFLLLLSVWADSAVGVLSNLSAFRSPV